MIKLSPRLQAVLGTMGIKRRKYTETDGVSLYYMVATDSAHDRAKEVFCPSCCEHMTDDDLTVVGAMPLEGQKLDCRSCGKRIA